MTKDGLSRRGLFRTGAGGVATGGLLLLAGAKPARATQYSYAPQLNAVLGNAATGFLASFDKAYSFLNTMMDAYAQGSTIRLVQSYSDQQGLESTAFTYDNAVVIHAYLVRGESEDVSRAEVLGNGFLYAQQNDSFNDGRLRQAYFVNSPDTHGAYVQPAGAPFYFFGSSTGDLAWAGLALAQLYRQTHNSNYLSGAVKLATWIYTNTFDTRGAGGYTAGVDGKNNKLMYKATEHNIDVYAFFTMLATLTGNSSWTTRAQSAAAFVKSMWNATGAFFWTGTGNDGVTINTGNIPEDVQTWSFLAFLSNTYAASIDWALANLATIDTPQTINSKLTGNTFIQGETYASLSLRELTPSESYDQAPDPNAVWLEGTAHTVAALFARSAVDLFPPHDLGNAASDTITALQLLNNIMVAQQKLGVGQTVGGTSLTAGHGVVASSSVLNGGFGSSYYPNLHIGATGWYLIAGQASNPYRLGYRDF